MSKLPFRPRKNSQFAANAEVNDDAEMTDDSFLEEFTLFRKLPEKVKLLIWDHAFPSRIVNVVFSEEQNAHLSFNSKPPLLLQISKETREIGLKKYRRYVGQGLKENLRNPWIDSGRDIVLINDNYQEYIIEHVRRVPLMRIDVPQLNKCLGSYTNEPFQKVAIGIGALPFLDHSAQSRFLQAATEKTLATFPAIKHLYIVYEDGVNPSSRGRIRFFPMERTCYASCENEECSNLASVTAECQEAIDMLRASKEISDRGLMVHFVGAWRGGNRAEFGHALDGLEDESDDDSPDEWDDPEDVYACDENMEDAGEIAEFSDHEEVGFSDNEAMSLQEDNRNFQKLVPGAASYNLKQGQALSAVMEDPDDYYEWRKANGGKLFPIFHPDGSYRAV